jgi:hypothetical protein
MDPNPTSQLSGTPQLCVQIMYIFHFDMSDGKTQPQLRAIEPAPYAVFFAPSGPESEGFLVPVRVFCTWSCDFPVSGEKFLAGGDNLTTLLCTVKCIVFEI